MADVPDEVLADAIWGYLPGLDGCETEDEEIAAVRLALAEARREVARPEYDSVRSDHDEGPWVDTPSGVQVKFRKKPTEDGQ